MATRIRIDRMIVERGLVDSREKATKLIMAGDVFVDGERVDKAGALISPEAEVELRGRSPYVSRGGEKLTHALDHFNINVLGKMCIDVGASTGGFSHFPLPPGAPPACFGLAGPREPPVRPPPRPPLSRPD